jgi:DNA polymerase III subunit epsilon
MFIKPDLAGEDMMKNNRIHYEPDYNLLNQKAIKSEPAGNDNQKEKLLSLFLPGIKKPEPIEINPVLFKKLSEEISEIKDNIDWNQNLFSASYVVFDTETTGLHPFRGDEIIAIGALKINQGVLSEQENFYRLVNPRRPIPVLAQRITGIKDQMVSKEKQIIPVLFDFLKYCGPRILVAHNAPFDLAFINNKVSEASGRRIVNPVIDTVLLTSALFFSLGDFSLENLSSRFKLDLTGRHNALGDARIAAELFLKLLPVLKERNIHTLHQLASLFSDSDLTKGYPLIF